LFLILKDNFEKYEVIFVNDFCTDGSIRTIKETISENKEKAVSIINMSIFQGIELSMNAGIDLAIGDFIFEFDSVCMDYDHDKVMEVYFRALSGHDIVSASPKKGIPISSRLFYGIFNYFSEAKYTLRSERFRILSRRAVNRVQSISKVVSYRKAAYANSGLSVDCIEYIPSMKHQLPNSEHLRSRKDTAFDSLIMFTGVAYKISILMTILLFIMALSAGIYTIIIYTGENRPVSGWTTTMILLSVGFSGVFMVMAIIIKYLSILVELILKRQRYLVESIEKISR